MDTDYVLGADSVNRKVHAIFFCEVREGNLSNCPASKPPMCVNDKRFFNEISNEFNFVLKTK